MTDLQENLKLMLEQLSYEQAMLCVLLDYIGQEKYEQLKEYKLNSNINDRGKELRLYDSLTYFIAKSTLLDNEIEKLETGFMNINLANGTGSFLI